MTELEKSTFYSKTNEDRLKAIGNIYFIYSNRELVYIGQRQAKNLKTRLDQHLFGKSYSVDENEKVIELKITGGNNVSEK